MTTPRKALIFGAGGQDAFYLGEQCAAAGMEVLSISRSSSPVHADAASYAEVEALVKNLNPVTIFHLAANSTTRHDAVFDNLQTISIGTINILEAARRHAPGAKVFITGSGVQFQNTGQPISEADPFEANSPYSVARIHSVYAARYYRSLGMPVYVGYLFHHESPLRKPHHVAKMIALAVGEIRDGKREFIELGDISVEKEWAFAGDITAGILALVSQDAIFEACIGSGMAYSIQGWIEECFTIIGKDWRNHVRQRAGFRPEYARLVSNPSKILSLGWRPAVGLRELAEMMVG